MFFLNATISALCALTTKGSRGPGPAASATARGKVACGGGGWGAEPVDVKESTADELAAFDGSFLFTHTGYSGPAALNISRHVARWRWERPEADVFASFLPDVAAPDEDAFWRSLLASEGRKTAAGALGARMPRRAAEMIAAEAGLGAGARIGSLSREESARLRAALFECRLRISSVAGYGKAEATAGGASLDEIEPATMMSRIAPGLFVAGELCDVDGWLGGYNFQWAWSSGTVAGRGASAYCRRTKSAGGPRA